ncbi:MAG: hypothetical protein WCG95_05585 [bacterium]
MIERININSVNIDKNRAKSQPRFTGLVEGATSLIQMCEQNPMINVTVLDLATAIVPRSLFEGQTNPYAGFEAFRRESSGLIVNCLIPSAIVWVIAKALEKPIMGHETKMSDCWANEDTINLVTKYWQNASENAFDENGKAIFVADKNRAKVYNTGKNILKDIEGKDGTKIIKFKEFGFDDSLKTITENTFKEQSAKSLKAAYEGIVSQTHVAENIMIKGHGPEFFSQNLESIVQNMPKILKELVGGNAPSVETFAKQAKKLLFTKSLLGLGVIIPLAVSMQPINRWITAKTSGKKGAPIYRDFAQAENKELSPKEKSALFQQKLISVSAMVGVALLSIMKKPNFQMLKNISQFKGAFPSMDQARVISTATFASRMMASEDKNDLREATVRDIATFSAFYFLGDYVAKGIATAIQKFKGIELINVLKEPDKNANLLKKFGHWAKHTALKSSDEIVGESAKKMRSLCQLGNIGFSLLALGLLIPMINRKQTDKAREAELKDMGVDQQTISKYYPPFTMNITASNNHNVYNAFFTANK